ncbi:UNVERIFIED_CONTAM: hypothetical protein RMT77_001758 [Armadillidium vulgare]|nr:Multivesicular body subunit 12B [Armadillidium vulgare]
MMRDLYNSLPLPDDRPITSLCIVEEISGCPPNYTVVSKTHDQDIDADLCKDGFFKRISRYLCHSKTEGFFGYVVEHILILNDKESRPAGYTILEQTSDTNQRAFRKKQLCYKAVPRHMATQTITDIIILSRSKVAPSGFSLFGEMNGLSICYKPGPATGSGGSDSQKQTVASSLPYSVNPNGRGSISSIGSGNSGIYPVLPENLRPKVPSRQAPLPPGMEKPQYSENSSDSIYDSAQSSISGIPFILNKKYVENSLEEENASTNFKSRQQIEDEYYYSFALEQDIANRTT